MLPSRVVGFLRLVPGLQLADLLPDHLLPVSLLLSQLLQPVLQLIDVSLCTETTQNVHSDRKLPCP